MAGYYNYTHGRSGQEKSTCPIAPMSGLRCRTSGDFEICNVLGM